jgi:hypothetical protein
MTAEAYRRAVSAWEHHDTMINQSFPLILTAVAAVVAIAFVYLGRYPLGQVLVLEFGAFLSLTFTLALGKLKVYADAFAMWADELQKPVAVPFGGTRSLLLYLGVRDPYYFDDRGMGSLLRFSARRRVLDWYLAVGIVVFLAFLIGGWLIGIEWAVHLSH